MGERENKSKLLRAVGVIGIALVALNSTIGSGIFTLLDCFGTGWFCKSMVIFDSWNFNNFSVLTCGRLAVFSLALMAPFYTLKAFGPLVGFSTGWILYISRATAFAANSNALALYLGSRPMV